MDGFLEILAEPYWSGVSSIAFVVTLFVVIIYTSKTSKIARVQEEEIGLQKRPVVSFWIKRKNEQINLPDLEPWVFCKNFSTVHAKARVKITIEVLGKSFAFESSNPYSGKPVWHVQATGSSDMAFRGNFHLPENFDDHNRNAMKEGRLLATLRLESWAINFGDPERLLWNDQYKNPTLVWQWGPKKRWIPNMTPDTIHGALFDVE